MTTALEYLTRMTDSFFAAQMQRAARKISEQERYFRRAA